jgi:L-lactate dehydrogenase complex protein LldG
MGDAGFERVSANDPHVEVGITGVDAALAATGSLVLMSGPDQPRAVSLLPTTHLAIVREEQILPHFEAWVTAQRAAGFDAFRQTSNVIVISGPSRTADIGMELILGAHGPMAVQIVLISAAHTTMR